MIELGNAVIRNETSENKNKNNIMDTVVKILNFNENQKGRGLKILNPKQMLQRLRINQ